MTDANSPRRILKNFGVILRGHGIAAIFTFSAMALMANALPAVEFGLVILLHTYVLAVRGILNFRTYEAIVRFGVPMHENGENESLKGLFRTTTLIDLISGVFATLAAVAVASVAGGVLNWNEQMQSLASVYSLIMLSTVSNTPNGILRLYDRFDALSIFYMVGPSIRITGTVIAWATGAGMHTYIVIWGLAFIAENCWLFIRGHLELNKHLDGGLWRGGSWRKAKFNTREFRHFIAIVYWQTNVDFLPKHLSILLAGSLLGPAAAGMFRLARDFSSVLSKPAMMLREVLFPDLTRILHSGAEGFHKLGFRAVGAAGAAGLLLVLISIPAAAPLLGIIGSEYTEAAPLVTLMLLAGTFELAASPLRAAAYAMGKVGQVLRIYLLSVLIYFGLFGVLTPVMGLPGPGVSASVGTLLTLLLMMRLVRIV